MTAPNPQSLQREHVVITGGGSGVGAEIAHSFAQAGAAVTILGRRLESLKEVAEDIGALAFSANATDRALLDAALERVRDAQV
ncbi:SDR family NAD(P)-dependent oxidoreductase [Planktotalea arctica]|uniref:SDR family NAD(P)-dependent oxidoreductase n=1 Tax=Planktotalea arctica TaxID=1481893 RepID=UPI003CCBF623